MNRTVRWLAALVAAVALCPAAFATTDWSAQDYDLYSGDFDGDTKADVLYIARDPSKASGIARSDGTGPNIPFQSWPSNYLGLPWYGNTFNVVVADFNHDGHADIFLQRKVAGDHYLLLANSEGKITGINQTIANSSLGVVWSGDQHRIITGDFNHDGYADLFLQSTARGGLNAVMLASASGTFQSNPTQSWNDSPSPGGFKWSTQDANVFAGDFNGDGFTDLLIQARPQFAMIDFDPPFPVPVYAPNMNGVVLAQNSSVIFSSASMKAWSRIANGVDWSPLTNNVIVGDFNGDGSADVLLQARTSGRSSYLVTASGTANIFTTAGSAISANVGISADVARVFAVRFGSGASAALYIQTLQPGGTNYIATTVSATISASAHDPSSATGVLPATAVGMTSGSFTVSDQGAANYSIPIAVPPGVSDIQPSLSLVYQSGSGNGLLGVGWDLAGLSVIDRCRKTLVEDNSIDSVKLASSDALCLDGNKLRLTSGSYGGASSTYETQIQKFARITAYGPIANGPDHFIVEEKSGLTLEYGNTADSRIESTASGFSTTARLWALNKVSDRYGNTMTIVYQEDGASGNGSFRPLTITYTSNPAASLAAAYKVSFVWETRPASDTLTSYIAGGRIVETQRLSRIETQYNDPIVGGFRLVRSYRLSYNTSGAAPRSLLGAIQECDRNGSCLSPTNIAWQDGLAGLGTEISASNLGSLAAGALPADLNGDGRVDLVFPGTSNWGYMLANSSGGYDPAITSTTAHNNNYSKAMLIDYDGDGAMDLLVPNASNNWQVLKFNGGGFTVITPTLSGSPIPATGAGGSAWAADANGDGLQDLVYVASDAVSLYVIYNSPSGFAGSPQLALSSSGTPVTLAAQQGDPSDLASGAFRYGGRVADFNGDGRADLLVPADHVGPPNPVTHINSHHYYWQLLISTPTGYTATFGAPSASNSNVDTQNWNSIRPLDLNGDGVVDLAYVCSTTLTWCVRFGTASGLGPEQSTGVAAIASASVVALDWNGDGLTDILQAGTSGNWLLVAASSGTAAAFATSVDTGIPAVNAASAAVGDVNGDGGGDLLYSDTSFNWHFRLRQGPTPDLVRAFTDGFGNTTNIVYSQLSDASVYTKGSGASFPQMDLQAPLTVVKQYTSNDGIGGSYTVTASYTAARIHLQGRGYEGFSSVAFTDSRTGIKNTKTFRQDFPFIGMPASIISAQSNGKVIAQTINTWTDLLSGSTYSDRHFVYLGGSVETRNEVSASNASIDGQGVTQVTTATSVDTYGNTTVLTTTVADLTGSAQTYTTQTVNTIPSFDLTNWCLDFVTQRTITNTVPGPSTATRTVQYVPDTANPAKCRASQEIVEPGSSLYAKTTAFQYDSLGHVNQTSVTGTGITARVTIIGYGSQGVFPVSLTNAENETEGKGYDYALGVPTSATDANNITVSWGYDGFGRKTRESRPDGTATTWTHYACNIGNAFCGDSLLRSQIYEQRLDSSGTGVIRYSIVRNDSLGRPKYEESQAFSGASAIIKTDYDNQGRVTRRSQPYFIGATQFYTVFTYDLIGRTLTETRPLNEADSSAAYPYCSTCRTSNYAYSRLTHTFTDANGNGSTKVLNSLGQVIQTTDVGGGITQYRYDPFGNLKQTTDHAGNIVSAGYNVRGFKSSSGDPDMGNWTYDYYPTGELKTQTDAKGQVVTYTYDRAGRPLTRIEPEGQTTITWGTSQSARNIGQVSTIASPGGYQELRTYDQFGRPQELRTTIDGTNYFVTNSYNTTSGLLETVIYPTSAAAVSGSRFKVQYDYSYGLLADVKDFYSPSTVYWQRVATDASGRTIDEQSGNTLHTYSTYDLANGFLSQRFTGGSAQIQNLQYQWDKVGNLSERKDLTLQLTEHFYYDGLNRLDYSTLKVGAGSASTNLDPVYNAIGNITSKTGVGSYDYATAQSGCSYTTNGVPNAAQPHAVRNVGGTSYCYDANGNMTKRGSDVLQWTSYNLPSVINRGGNSTQLFYGAGRQRIKQISSTTTAPMPTGLETTVYVGGGLFEKVLKPSGVIEYKHYLVADEQPVAIRTLRSNNSNDTRYLHKDHLGSIDTITDETAAVVLKESFDAFGARRDPTMWSGTPSTGHWSTIAAITHLGFTGHEGLDNVGLIHMNGRVYDPVIGRFISADPFVQAPLMSQSLNRYSYVFNNPLSLVDPSGFFLKGLFRKIGDYFEAIGRNLNYIVAAVLYVASAVAYAYGYAPLGDALSTAATALLKSPVQLTRGRNGGFGVSVGYAGFGVTADPSLGGNTGPPSNWGTGGPPTIAGVPVIYEREVEGGQRTVGLWDFLHHSATEVALSYGDNSWSLAFWNVFAGGWVEAGNDALEGHYGLAILTTALAVFPELKAVKRVGRFVYDNRVFRTISSEYWETYGPAAGRSLHHWLIPQRWSWIPQGVRNGGWNLLELPEAASALTSGLGLNQWMGFAARWGGVRAAAAFMVENGIRVAVPGSLIGGAYGGYRLEEWWWGNEEQ